MFSHISAACAGFIFGMLFIVPSDVVPFGILILTVNVVAAVGTAK